MTLESGVPKQDISIGTSVFLKEWVRGMGNRSDKALVEKARFKPLQTASGPALNSSGFL